MYIRTVSSNKFITVDEKVSGEFRSSLIDNRSSWEHSLTGASDDEGRLEHVNDISEILDKFDKAGTDGTIILSNDELQELVDCLDVSGDGIHLAEETNHLRSLLVKD